MTAPWLSFILLPAALAFGEPVDWLLTARYVVTADAAHRVIENGAVAVNAYMANRPDAVLMDVTMPEMDGLAALKAIRSSDPNARVVMLTALGQESVVLEAIKSGAKDFVVKPFEPARVLAAISKALV